MNDAIRNQIEDLEKRLDYHGYLVETEHTFPIGSLIETLEAALIKTTDSSPECPDVTLPFRDVIETLHQINDAVLRKDKDEIDRDFFGTGVHLPVSFDVSVIAKSLLDCHHRFKIHGVLSDILILYAWLLNEAWYRILCQDTLDLWSTVIEIIHKKLQYVDKTLYLPLLGCIPKERY